MNKISTYSCLFLALIFSVFAAVQYNDPDPEVWIPIYMAASILCIASIFIPVNRILLSVIIVAYMVGGIYLFPEKYQGVSMPMNQRVPAIELARESLGLLICAIACSWLLFLSNVKKAKANTLR